MDRMGEIQNAANQRKKGQKLSGATALFVIQQQNHSPHQRNREGERGEKCVPGFSHTAKLGNSSIPSNIPAG
jgi:hypothetical protein